MNANKLERQNVELIGRVVELETELTRRDVAALQECTAQVQRLRVQVGKMVEELRDGDTVNR